MKTYRITHMEKLLGHFYVKADSPEEALDEFCYQINNGNIDFSDLEMIDSDDIAEEVE